ncbi:MAG: dihydropteroate synthase, partial [Rhodospirillales bacterium]
DSFSDGGDFLDSGRAIEQGLQLTAEGADIIDIGGESTRPGADPVSPEDEIARVVSVIEVLAREGVCVSIDTRHAAVMRAAAEAGAAIINDVGALRAEGAVEAAADLGLPVVLMHMQGKPGTMQVAPQYENVVSEVRAFLFDRIEACLEAGIPLDRIAVDPGIGFGKTQDHNMALMMGLEDLADLGCPILVGVSRKSLIGHLTGVTNPKERGAGSIAAGLAAVENGAHILRVHDVAETVQALKVWRALTV